MYGSHGVCRVTDVREEAFGPVRQTYYVLQPTKDARSIYYCPIKQEEKLRALLTKDEVYRLIREMPQTDTAWEEDDAARRAAFKETLKSGDPLDQNAVSSAADQGAGGKAPASCRRAHHAGGGAPFVREDCSRDGDSPCRCNRVH